MNFRILYKGNDISGDCLTYERNHVLCDGIGTLRMSTTLNAYTFEPYELITIEEDGHTKGKYYIVSIDGLVPENITQVTAQDASKRLSDYFVWEVTETGDAPTYTKDWIEKYLSEAGVSYAFDVAGSGTIVSNNMSYGRQSAMEIITELLKQSGWYLHTDSGGTVRIGKITIDMTNPAGYFDDTDIIRIDTAANDTSLRNQVTVWGNGNPVTGDYVFAKLYVPTPWDRDALDIRKVGINVAGVREDSTAAGIASQILKETTKLTYIKTVDLTGFRNIHIGDTAFIESDYYTGGGIVTTISCKVNGGNSGAITTLTLDERCERMVGFYDFGDYVYVGTNGGGVWRKHIRYDHTWYDYSQGLSNLVIPDLAIKDGVFACVDGLGNLYTRYASEAAWVKFVANSRFIDDVGTVYSSSNLECVACTINRSNNHVFAIFNLPGQVVKLEVMGVTVYQIIGTPKCWVVDLTNRNTYLTQLIVIDGKNEVFGLDIDHNSSDDYITVLYKKSEVITYPNVPNVANTPPYFPNSLDLIDTYGIKTGAAGTGHFGAGNYTFYSTGYGYSWSRRNLNDGTSIGPITLPWSSSFSTYAAKVSAFDENMLFGFGSYDVTPPVTFAAGFVDFEHGGNEILFADESVDESDVEPYRDGYHPTSLAILSGSNVTTAVMTIMARYSTYSAPNWTTWFTVLCRTYNYATDTLSDWFDLVSSNTSVGPSRPAFSVNLYMSPIVDAGDGSIVGVLTVGTTPQVFQYYPSTNTLYSEALAGLTTLQPVVSHGNGVVYLPTAKQKTFAFDIAAHTLSTVISDTTKTRKSISTSAISACLLCTDYTVYNLWNSADTSIVDVTGATMGRFGNDSDGDFLVSGLIGGIQATRRYTRDFSSYVDLALYCGTNPSVYGPIILKDTGSETDYEISNYIVPSGIPISISGASIGFWPYGCIRPTTLSGDYTDIGNYGLLPRVDCSQDSPVVIWGDGAAHGWMYLSDSGNLGDYHLVDPGYTTGFLYFGPRVYHETTYSGGIDGGHYYGRILYPHANAVWNYDTENETQYGSHYTDDPQEGEYYDFSHEVKAVETTNYLDKPYFFVACSGTGTGSYFYQKNGNYLGETESFTWDDYSAGLPTEEILTIRIDDRN